MWPTGSTTSQVNRYRRQQWRGLYPRVRPSHKVLRRRELPHHGYVHRHAQYPGAVDQGALRGAYSVAKRGGANGYPNTHSDAAGRIVVTGIPPGTYVYRASGPRHADKTGRVFVRPGVTITEQVHLKYQTISIDFSVNETTIQDVYNINLEATFQTQVPAPVVLLEPLSINIPELQVGEEATGELTLTNYGLVRADNVKFTPPQSDEYYKYECFWRKFGRNWMPKSAS